MEFGALTEVLGTTGDPSHDMEDDIQQDLGHDHNRIRSVFDSLQNLTGDIAPRERQLRLKSYRLLNALNEVAISTYSVQSSLNQYPPVSAYLALLLSTIPSSSLEDLECSLYLLRLVLPCAPIPIRRRELDSITRILWDVNSAFPDSDAVSQQVRA